MPLGLLDISSVTDRLIKLLDEAKDKSPLWKTKTIAKFTIKVTGDAPEVVRNRDNCQLSLYLFHVAQDKYQTNSPVTGYRVPPIPHQPLSLNLYYLLTAFAKDNYRQEQQAMSIAMRCFHENPIVRMNVDLGTQTIKEEFTLTMAVETADELGRLWQATTVPLRLAAVYKVSVVFMTPPEPPSIARPPDEVKLISDDKTQPLPDGVQLKTSQEVPFAGAVQILGTSATINYVGPDNRGRSISFSPATVALQQRFILYGVGLDNVGITDRLYRVSTGGTEVDVTDWIKAKDSTRLALEIPPSNLPSPGVYQLQIGRNSYRSNTTPFSIAAFVNPVRGPIETGNSIALQGQGFIADKTQVLLNKQSLTKAVNNSNTTLQPGQFRVESTTRIALQLPNNLSPGLYVIRVRVNQVESAPAKWVEVAP